MTELLACPGMSGEIWLDTDGVPINAHGGGILKEGNLFYWYGEHKVAGTRGNLAWVGVHVYRSDDLVHWCDAGIAFDIRNGGSLLPGCVIERPKVVRSPAGKFVMWFHLERDCTYSDARQAVAVADRPEGPFRLLWHGRPNPGVWPQNTPPELKESARIEAARREMPTLPYDANPLTPQLSVLGMDLETGQQSRDMTLFVDDDRTAYVAYASEKNST
ncbi:MAG: beta-glucanase, partial [Lentisphaeria bacterium]|nr:beta-glucanase [Lentisphaeria bacterium]